MDKGFGWCGMNGTDGRTILLGREKRRNKKKELRLEL
jgi:hypothetical protein